MPTATTISSSPSTTAPSPTGTASAGGGAGPPLLVTTSWDDGHPLDWRIAELLARYDLPGTFYVPRTSQRPTMPQADVRRLAERFEIGGHTLDHLTLTTLGAEQSRRQIDGCKAWVQDVTGRPCRSFCPPLGKFAPQHLAAIRDAGFSTVRTVELLSIDWPRHPDGGVTILPTSVQAHPHGMRGYLKNTLRRRSVTNLLRALRYARRADWVALGRRLVDLAQRRGGVVHLWGHSWEIEENGQWGALEEMLRLLSSAAPSAARVTNARLAEIHAHRQARQPAA